MNFGKASQIIIFFLFKSNLYYKGRGDMDGICIYVLLLLMPVDVFLSLIYDFLE